MPKVPDAAENHGHSPFIGRINHFLVTHAAAWLNDASRTRINHHVQAVPEREKRVTRRCAALQ